MERFNESYNNKQQEPRVLCHLCQDQNLIEAYRTGKDIYAQMASEAFKMPYEDCREFYMNPDGTKKLDEKGEPIENVEGHKRRSRIKGVLLGLLYGESTATMAEGAGVTMEEAQKIIDDFFEAYPRNKDIYRTTTTNSKTKRIYINIMG